MAPRSFTIEVRPPFRLDLTIWALRRRELNRMDRWDGRTYQRTIFAGKSAIEIAVTQIGRTDEPRLHVNFEGETSGATRRFIRNLLNRVLGLDIDLFPFYRISAQDQRLNDLATRFRGMRPPRFPTIFEALVNGIACQQFSLEAGLSLLNRLAASHGRAPLAGAEAGKAFPRSWDMASASLESLRALGFSRSKGVAIIEIARAIECRDILLDQLDRLDDGMLQARLDELRGVGRWTAEYVLLRGYGRLNIFPGDDVGARNGLQRWLGLRKPLDYQRTKSILRRWQPYSGLIYLHLLLKSLYEKGMIRASAELCNYTG